MERFVPYEKLSKKKKRELDALRRRTWGPLNPVTRKPPNSKAYKRSTADRWKREGSTDLPSLFLLSAAIRPVQRRGAPLTVRSRSRSYRRRKAAVSSPAR